jgi:hypothetical protein
MGIDVEGEHHSEAFRNYVKKAVEMLGERCSRLILYRLYLTKYTSVAFHFTIDA